MSGFVKKKLFELDEPLPVSLFESIKGFLKICLVMFEFLGMGLVGVVECVSGSWFGDGGGFLGGECDVGKEVGGEITVVDGTVMERRWV
ncbi:hypothetical protein Tco_1180568 [Tanacetum coccineum]